MRYFNLVSPVNLVLIAIVMISLLSAQTAQARQFRQMTPIPVQPAPQVFDPSSGMSVLGLNSSEASTISNTDLIPIDQQLIADEINKIVQSWNTAGLERYLHETFPQRFQLLSVLERDVPRDASLQVLSIQNISTLNQVWASASGYNKQSRISSVIATVNLQLRFIDPFKGVVTLPHTSQFYLRVAETE